MMSVSPLIAEAYRRAPAPLTPLGLRDTFLALVEHLLDGGALRPGSALHDEDLFSHPATAGFVKELFNSFFRDELYGRYRDDSHVIFSSGSPHEPTFPLPNSLKSCIHMALDRDWYGYSDSRGRVASRQAVAALESQRIAGAQLTEANVALTIGGTFAAGCLFDFLLSGRRDSTEPSLCAVPNYAPLVSSLSKRAPVRLVETPTVGGFTDLSGLLQAVNQATPLVFLQTVTNPTGVRVRAEQLAELHRRAAPTTLVVLDEAHDCYGPEWQLPRSLNSDNVLRIASLSKRLSIPGIKLGWIVAAESVIAEYYEYASTMYGGPSSFFCLLVEVAARFQRWTSRPDAELSAADLREFEPAYGFDLLRLQAMFDDYVASGQRRLRHINRLRARFMTELSHMDHTVTDAQYSVNLAVRPPADMDGWVYYRRLLADAGVAVFPGILTMSFGDPLIRMTVARANEEITEGLHRMKKLWVD
jgi:aspartate/methionine/tyrosine aminotransferase